MQGLIDVPFFMSSYTQKVDKKGRTSVPSQFRAVVEGSSFAGVLVYYVAGRSYIDGSDEEFLKTYHQRIASQFNDDIPKKRQILRSLLGGSAPLVFDPEGRVTLPAHMREAIGITDQAVFVGAGDSFEIWSPERHAKEKAESDLMMKEAVNNIPALFDL